MPRFTKKHCVILFLSLALFVSGTCFAGSAINVTKIIYVDYDGDGFDDLAIDDNDNGIPDIVEGIKEEPIVEVSSQLGDVFGSNTAEAKDLYLNTEEAFGARDFATRSLCSHRTGFNAGEDFGPGNGLGIGNVAGGCEGGVCH